MSEKILIDGTELYLGFTFHTMNPVIKTDLDFTTKKKLTGTDEWALRYIALDILDQLEKIFYPGEFVDWAKNNKANFFASDALYLNNTDGVICANGDILHCLYLAPGGQIMGYMSDVENLDETYDVLIS